MNCCAKRRGAPQASTVFIIVSLSCSSLSLSKTVIICREMVRVWVTENPLSLSLYILLCLFVCLFLSLCMYRCCCPFLALERRGLRTSMCTLSRYTICTPDCMRATPESNTNNRSRLICLKYFFNNSCKNQLNRILVIDIRLSLFITSIL